MRPSQQLRYHGLIALHLRPALPSEPPDPRAYRIAGLTVTADLPLPALAPFAASTGTSELLDSIPPPVTEESGGRVFQGQAFLGGRERPVEGRSGPGGTWLSTDGAACTVSPDGRTIAGASAAEGLPLLVDLVLGPALCLALALRGVFCLHAGAVEVDGRIVAFLGDSGAGKSTLARLLGWQRAADDILPVAGPTASRPRFPQLKLAPQDQPGAGLPEELPLAAFYCLDPPAEAIAVRPLSSRDAALSLVRHTVAARLFDPVLLERHLGFCARVAAEVPVRALAYPRELGVGPGVREAIAADLGLPEGLP